MSVVTILCSAYAAVCATFAAVHLSIWIRDRQATANLWFSVTAAGVAGFTWAEFAHLRARVPVEAGMTLQWTHVSIGVIVLGIVLFVRRYIGAGHAWLGHGAWIIRAVLVAVTFSRPQSADFSALPRIETVTLLGEPVSVAVGQASAWHWVAQVGFAMLVAYVIDAAIGLWRSGGPVEKRRALTIGGSTAVFAVLGPIWAALIFSGVAVLPHIEFLFFFPMTVAMATELGSDVLRAAELAGRLRMREAALRESEQRMALAVETAQLGMWVRDFDGSTLWLSDRCRTVFGFPPSGAVTWDEFALRTHPADRARWDHVVCDAVVARTPCALEYRILLPDRTIRWIASRANVETAAAGAPVRMLGVCLDVSEPRNAESAARDLSGRLINAQEDERRRIARELHDDLSQRLALLSIEVDMLGSAETAERSSERADAIAASVRDLAAEVHRMAYQLHPAKLDQLGLEAAAASLCRDLARQSHVAIEFSASCLPADLPPDIALCLYRVVQESLRNVVRHSGSPSARVALSAEPSGLRLAVSDRGRGFDAGRTHGGLGLVSMRERVRTVDGTLTLRSNAQSGTVIEVLVPLAGEGPLTSAYAVRQHR